MKWIIALLLASNANAGLPPTCVKGSTDSTCSTAFQFLFPNIPFTYSGVQASMGAIPNAALANSSTTVGGASCSLGGSCSVSSSTAIQKGHGSGGLTAASSGTDYQAPISTSASVSHQFLTAWTAPNTFSRAQPAAADLSDGVTGSGAVCLASAPTLTNPIVGTQSAGDNSTKAASTAYADNAAASATGFLKLAGRSGGQSAAGGTGASDNLTLQSTTNGTVGSVIIANQASEKAQIGATGSTTVWSNPVEVMTANSNSLTNGFVIHDNSANWPSSPSTASSSSQGFLFLPKDNGGTSTIFIRGANNQSILKHYNASDGTYTGYFSMGLPWGFMNANAGITTLKVSGTTGQSVDIQQWSNQNDFGNPVSAVAKDGHFKSPAGSTSVAGYGLFGTAGIGMYFPSTSTIGWTIGSAQKMLLSATALTLPMYGTGILHSDSTGLLSSSAVALGGADVSGTLLVGNGGTGLATLTAHALYAGNGTSAPTALAVGTTNTVLHGNTGADPSYSAIVNADITNATIDLTTKVTGVLPSANVGGGRTINAQTGTTYTFVLGDASNAGGSPLVTGSNASAETFTVPPQSSVAWLAGAQIDVCQQGAGKLTLAQGSGVTINSKSSNKSVSAQYVCVTLIRTASDVWTLAGDLIP